MVSITIPADSTFSYRVPALNTSRGIPQIRVDVQDGTHTFTSPDFELGTVTHADGRTLFGRIIFTYTFDAAAPTITVAGTEFSSNDTMVLVTQPEDIDELCVERTTSEGLTQDEKHRNSVWNYRTQLMPGAEAIFKKMVRDTNQALIDALKQQDQLIVRIRTPLPSVPTELYHSLCMVSRNGKLLGFYDGTKDYGDDVVVQNFESTWGGTVHMNLGEKFANVIGSTGDPQIAGQSWIQLWANQFGGYPNVCTSYNYQGFNCGNTFVGGHVISGQAASRVAVGSNDVYIYPICHAHNNNDNVYMAALRYLDGVWLNNYQQ